MAQPGNWRDEVGSHHEVSGCEHAVTEVFFFFGFLVKAHFYIFNSN